MTHRFGQLKLGDTFIEKVREETKWRICESRICGALESVRETRYSLINVKTGEAFGYSYTNINLVFEGHPDQFYRERAHGFGELKPGQRFYFKEKTSVPPHPFMVTYVKLDEKTASSKYGLLDLVNGTFYNDKLYENIDDIFHSENASRFFRE